MDRQKYAIIGAGNMGSAIAEGFIKTGKIKPENIFITDQRPEPLAHFKQKGLHAGKNNCEAVEFANIIIIAVKPYLVKMVLEEIKPALKTKTQILISIAAGISIGEIQSVTGTMAIFRIIPNTAISIQESMTSMSEANTNQEQKDLVINLFSLLGKAVFLPEELIDSATVIGSCGTGYALRYMRALIEGGVEIGVTPKIAQLIAAQTLLGASKLLLDEGNHPEVEIDKVTTPKGSTIAGLNEMEHHGFSSSVIKGILASYNKIKGH
jgi:pyrroline-5-carboxylate reductase